MAENKQKIYLPGGNVVTVGEDALASDQYEWVDKTLTYTENGEQVRFTPEDILVAAARMLRDGKSLDYIMTELDVDRQIVSYRQLERAIRNVGMPLLEKRIAQGQEAAESRVLLHKDLFPLRADEGDE
jgi:hypothetical protein